MKLTDAARAVVYPLTESSVLVPIVVFWLLVTLAGAAGILGVWLAIVIVPAVFRYQVLLLEARAQGMTPQVPGIEFFSWTSNLWTLFPVVIGVVVGLAGYKVYGAAGMTGLLVFVAFAGAVYPAILGVLAITHSPLQSINPAAILRFISRCGMSYWYAPLFMLFSAFVSLHSSALGGLLSNLLEMLLLFSLHSLIGSIIHPLGLIDEVDIPDPTERPEEFVEHELEKKRTQVLDHAYGLISRDNRTGGFGHIFKWFDEDPDPARAWSWFFEQMLKWENKQPALFFAQHYLHDLLHFGEQVPAVKLIMRCRLINEEFRPLPEDLAAAIEAAEAVSNVELVAALRRN